MIPPKEAQEFMVRVGRKKLEEQRGRTENVERYRRRLKFWGELLPTLSGKAADLFSNRSPGKDHWLSGSTGHSGCLLYTSPSPRDATLSRMPSSA